MKKICDEEDVETEIPFTFNDMKAIYKRIENLFKHPLSFTIENFYQYKKQIQISIKFRDDSILNIAMNTNIEKINTEFNKLTKINNLLSIFLSIVNEIDKELIIVPPFFSDKK